MILHKWRYIFRMRLHHHARIAPCRTTIARTHTVDHKLFWTRSCRNHKTARTHTETIYAPAIHLGYKTVFGCRQILATTVLVVILYLIDDLRRMLQTDTHRNALRLNLYLGRSEIAIHVTGTMTSSQDHRSTIVFLRTRLQVDSLHTYHLVALQDEAGHLGLEMHLTTTLENGIAHILDDTRQLVGTDMRMGIS